VVVVCPSWVGDTVMATPVLRALREARPGARLTAVLRPGLAKVLAGCPWLNEVIEIDNRRLLGPWRAAGAIREREPEAALLLPNSFRSALTVRLAGVPRRIGYARDARRHLLTHCLSPRRTGEPTPTISYYCRLAHWALGVETIDPTMQVFVTTEEQRVADLLLHEVREPFVVLNPGANKNPKRWPAERFADAAARLMKRFGCHAVVTGSPKEAALAEAVVQVGASHGVRIHNLVQSGIDLGSLKAVLERAAVLITNDTGPRHIALALGTPVVSLFGPTDYRWTMVPGVNEHVLAADPFLPYRLVADNHAKQCDIERISVGDVVASAGQFLASGSGIERAQAHHESDRDAQAEVPR